MAICVVSPLSGV